MTVRGVVNSRAEAFLGAPVAAALTLLDEAHLKPGSTLGSYRIDRVLGQGGMGTVFLAYDTTLHRRVALKVVSNPGTDHEAPEGRLLREARNAAALNHPNIRTTYEVSEADGTAYIAMEYVDGRTLRERLDEGALPLNDVVRYGVQAADALAFAHEHGVVHRDFKAANAMLTADGRLKIVDFGLAKRADALVAAATTTVTLVPAGAAVGTPYAMAPEQVRGEAADARTDVWALGVLLYEMATGVRPFDGATPLELFTSVLRDAPASWPHGTDVALKALVDRCLDKDPARRFQNARSVHEALAAIESGMAPPWTAWRYRLTEHRLLASTVAAIVVIAVSVGLNPGGLRDWLAGRSSEAPIRLAILPFENLTGDEEQEYFSDGLTDEMITQLGRLAPERLSVIARTSSMRYKNETKPIAEIGRELGVDYLLEGSARREGSRIRISATLIQVRDETQRWSETFERELSGILTLQNDVARGVAGSLALTLLPAEQSRLTQTPQVNPEAYEAYLKGRSHSARMTRPDLDQALAYYELALEKDPDYALAHLGISGVWAGRRVLSFVPGADGAAAAKAALNRALELDPALPQAHLALANEYTWRDWNWAAAEPEYRRAIEVLPNDADAHVFYARYLNMMQRPAEAADQFARALELDPLSEFVRAMHGAGLVHARRYDEAVANANALLRTSPDSSQALGQLGSALHLLQRYEESFAAERRGLAARNERQLDEVLMQGYGEGGYRLAMRRLGDALATRPFGRGRVPGLYVRAGEHELALDMLERLVAARENNLPEIGVAAVYQPLHDHPRFRALLAKMNLPPPPSSR